MEGSWQNGAAEMRLYFHAKGCPSQPLQTTSTHPATSPQDTFQKPPRLMLRFPTCPQRSFLHAKARESTQNSPTGSRLTHNKGLWPGHGLPLHPSLLAHSPPAILTSVIFLGHSEYLLSEDLCTFSSHFLDGHSSKYTYGLLSHLTRFSG